MSTVTIFVVLMLSTLTCWGKDFTPPAICQKPPPPGSDLPSTGIDLIWKKSSIHKKTPSFNFMAKSPGLKWCGDGDDAKNDGDLGFFATTDSCCRAHDNCVSNILAGQEIGNLKNNGLLTRLNCKCENEFYECLKKATSSPEKVVARHVGSTYFNVVHLECFSEVKCSPGETESHIYEWIEPNRF